MFERVKDFMSDEGGGNLVVMGIVFAVSSIIAYGMYSFLKPKIKGGADNAGTNLDDANAMTY